MNALWIVLLIITVCAYAFAEFRLLPGLIFKNRRRMQSSPDRGLKEIREKDGGRTIVYEPVGKDGKYVDQYALSARGGKTDLVCKIDEAVTSIVYDVAVFDSENRVKEVLSVRESPERRGYTHAVELPGETAYVALTVKEVNGKTMKTETDTAVSGKRVALYAVIGALLTVTELFLVKLFSGLIFGGIYYESFMDETKGALFFFLLGGTAILVNTLTAVISVKKLNAKKKGRAERDE